MIDIQGYEGRYAITEEGQVWSHLSKKFLRPYNNGHGYLCIKLIDANGKNKTKRINRLVAEAYLPNPEGKRDVEHLDNDRKNNKLSNLQWATRSENCRNENNNRNVERRRTPIKCVETGEVFKNQKEAAASVGVCRYNINNVITGKQKTAGGYHWERVEEDK